MRKQRLTTALAFGLLAMAAACSNSSGLVRQADGSMGGSSITGASTGTGGKSATDGSVATGGNNRTGGISAEGGIPRTGGGKTTGGVVSTGGTARTGGVIPSGGATCAGTTGIECPVSQWCDLPVGVCNTTEKPEETGACVSEGIGACSEDYSPVCGCDWKTYGNECERRTAKVSKRVDGLCPPPLTQCGGIAGLPCSANQWCEFPDKTCGASDQMGSCLLTESEACASSYTPVCGCDGKTYGNDCIRRDAQVSKQADGACPLPDVERTDAGRTEAGTSDAGTIDVGRTDAPTLGTRCGGIARIACSFGELCDFPADMCQGSDNEGTCEAIPKVCGDIYAPVCGCDNRTYGNDCERRAEKVQKKSSGVCPASVDGGQPPTGTLGSACGGLLQLGCLRPLYCDWAAGTCPSPIVKGTCQAKGSGACPAIFSPVCGCNNQTYSNDCVRQAAGVSLKYTGACLLDAGS
jgi:hypothetical protein